MTDPQDQERESDAIEAEGRQAFHDPAEEGAPGPQVDAAGERDLSAVIESWEDVPPPTADTESGEAERPEDIVSTEVVPTMETAVSAQEIADAEASAARSDDDREPEDPEAAVVEAILFASDSPVPASKISQVAELSGQKAVNAAVKRLNDRYASIGAAFRIEAIAGGYQLLTVPRYHDVLTKLFRTKSDSRLSQAALETMAIVAYRQPILRADIEAIRGVASGEILRGLMDKQLVKIVGRAEVLGRPMLYGTTKRFLEVFGLSSLEDLPRVEELRSGAKEPAAKPAEAKAAEAQPEPEQPAQP
ncbi:MAG: hypothetical protein BWX88_01155 [Planctomycetes bacterium ADurb.Bin126]|mgnify:CR=1 FL=1|nr:MAG: hypothetical protein BWX88_01155 [Planctomycetes bacterium ADurb.Bin126]HOD81229.1 SMC-Scp complex subunit ScpB [Phycisphaerae bacterium]HQL71793.1 SMC-Scp complex subunit ScpB [Phycisphaerae bacterium]